MAHPDFDGIVKRDCVNGLNQIIAAYAIYKTIHEEALFYIRLLVNINLFSINLPLLGAEIFK